MPGGVPKETQNERIKRETLELYEQLPQDYEQRIKRLDIRDKVFELNYSFFGYVAAHTFINNSSISYEDKFMSACTSFMGMWWKFQYHKYRCDLSFTVFFKPFDRFNWKQKFTTIAIVNNFIHLRILKQQRIHWSKYDCFDWM